MCSSIPCSSSWCEGQLAVVATVMSAQVNKQCCTLQGDFDLTNFQDGCLPAAFMVGLLVACPIFVQLAKTVQTFKLVGVGLLIWFVSVFSSGLTWDFWSLLFCRTAVGAGEASFVILAAPFIGVLAQILLDCALRTAGTTGPEGPYKRSGFQQHSACDWSPPMGNVT